VLPRLCVVARAPTLVVVAGCRWNFDAVDDADSVDDSAVLETALPSGIVYLTSGSGGSGQRLLTLDLATGALQEIGVLPPTYILSGLAYSDANTMYASGVNGDLVQITLSPLSAEVVGTIGGVVLARFRCRRADRDRRERTRAGATRASGRARDRVADPRRSRPDGVRG